MQIIKIKTRPQSNHPNNWVYIRKFYSKEIYALKEIDEFGENIEPYITIPGDEYGGIYHDDYNILDVLGEKEINTLREFLEGRPLLLKEIADLNKKNKKILDTDNIK